MALDVEGYPCEPRNLKMGQWFYEQKEGIVVCVAGSNNGIPFGTTTLTIPWSQLVAAVKRHQKARLRRKKK